MAATGERGSRIKVTHVITMLELGGAQENTLHTVRHLDRERFDVALVAGPGGLLDADAGAIPDLRLHFEPALHREVSPRHDLAALAALTRWLRAERPDIVHTHSSKAGILGRWAARRAEVPMVVHSIHGFGFTPGQRWPVREAFLRAEAWTAPLTTHFVAVSRANITQGVREGLFTRDQVTLIRSGIPLGPYRDGPTSRDEVRAELGLDRDALLVGSISCLKPQKDPLSWAETAARVLAALPGATFALAGDGELRPALEARLSQLGIAGRVRLLGWRRDVPRLVRAFDVLLHTSRWEGLPKVLPQAMAAGIPAVATAVDGAPEAVRDGDSGFLAAPGDADRLAAAVVRLLGDAELRRAMGRRGRARVDEFDIRHLAPAQEALYERLAAARAARRLRAA